MIPAYEGKDPYIFVSYAHRDSSVVFSVIEALVNDGYRVWYDEGIEPGSEWPENIANHLIESEMMLAFVTKNSMESANCRREINFALSKEKPFLSVIMEKADIPAGMQLQLSAQQSVLRYNYDDDERFLKKIESCPYLDPCRDGSVTPSGKNVSLKKSSPALKYGIIAFAVTALIVAALLILKPWKTGDDSNTEPTVTETAETTTASAVKWTYRISKTEDSILYEFDRGPYIAVPISWDNKILIMQTDNNVCFYHLQSWESWKNEGYDSGGVLFALCFSEEQDYKTFPSYYDIGSTSEGYYFIQYPSDFQGYDGNERIKEEYLEMIGEIDYVEMHSGMKN